MPWLNSMTRPDLSFGSNWGVGDGGVSVFLGGLAL